MSSGSLKNVAQIRTVSERTCIRVNRLLFKAICLLNPRWKHAGGESAAVPRIPAVSCPCAASACRPPGYRFLSPAKIPSSWEQLDQFTGIVYPRFPKPLCKLLIQMVLSLQSSKDFKLSNVAGALDEAVLLKKTAGRLSRNLKEESPGEKLNEIIAAEGASKIDKDRLIIVDPTGIRKEYAEKRPHLEFGSRNVKLPDRDEQMAWVVVKGLRKFRLKKRGAGSFVLAV